MSKTVDNEMQSMDSRRTTALKGLEKSLARELSRDEIFAFKIGWNCGFSDAIVQHAIKLNEALTTAPTAEGERTEGRN